MVPAVSVEGVSKRFRLYHEKYTSLKERVIHFGNVPFEEFWALSDINLEVGQGETVGLLGHNGSGKSTLLNCIAAILRPTTGRILVRGKLSAMLELGAGFHPELSGRENVYLNASLSGVPRREVERRFDDIVAFAELEQFIDNQVRFYSSGMYARLGFAVAVAFEPQVLLVDEVLSVGDENFQRKCLERIKRFQAEGRTIIFVSHMADTMRSICDRAFVLHHGKLVAHGPTGEAIRAFRDHLRGVGEPVGEVLEAVAAAEESAGGPTGSPHRVRISSVTLNHPGVGSRPYLHPWEPLEVRVGYEALERIEDPVFRIYIYDARGELVYGSDTDALGQALGPVAGLGEVAFSFDQVPLLDGSYTLTLGVESKGGGTVFDWRDGKDRFDVMNPGRSTGIVALPLRAELRPRGDLAEAPTPEAGGR